MSNSLDGKDLYTAPPRGEAVSARVSRQRRVGRALRLAFLVGAAYWASAGGFSRLFSSADDVSGPCHAAEDPEAVWGRASVALIKKPSKIPFGEKGYRGPVLFNPGGPGGSGVDIIRRLGDLFARILGDDYDIVGFDPRGIGRTTPKVSAFRSEAEGTTYALLHEDRQPLNSTADSFGSAYARADVIGSLSRARAGTAGQYVGTAFVARDMLSITRAHGREKLQYWGFSYGSVLGITYAAMFPHNIERLIVDGVVDTYNYYETQWSNNLRDTDAGWRIFLEECAAAGLDKCALHDSSADKIATRLERLYAALKARPIPVPLAQNVTHATSADYGVLSYGFARRVIFQFLRTPYMEKINAPSLAAALAAAEHGDGYCKASRSVLG